MTDNGDATIALGLSRVFGCVQGYSEPVGGRGVAKSGDSSPFDIFAVIGNPLFRWKNYEMTTMTNFCPEQRI
jgi:hypothetical protein